MKEDQECAVHYFTHGVCAEESVFAVSDGAAKETFFIRLTDPVRIAEARAIVSGKETTRVAVAGVVVTEPAAYNQPWHFHLAPESISFFKQAIEVCDATTSYVEAHLDEVGGAFLPGNKWCRGHRG
ncbi:calmodulin [Bradyrhizobium sp.]|uniref:BP74-related protein n=1 Tax=Bradyrhizobium sp. TaxID=376 RepID=UPI0025C02A3D|nr:calmodulin [Bradyrhizobium sp.]